MQTSPSLLPQGKIYAQTTKRLAVSCVPKATTALRAWPQSTFPCYQLSDGNMGNRNLAQKGGGEGSRYSRKEFCTSSLLIGLNFSLSATNEGLYGPIQLPHGLAWIWYANTEPWHSWPKGKYYLALPQIIIISPQHASNGLFKTPLPKPAQTCLETQVQELKATVILFIFAKWIIELCVCVWERGGGRYITVWWFANYIWEKLYTSYSNQKSCGLS